MYPLSLVSRVNSEIEMIMRDPPPGIQCWPVGESIVEFEAMILGVDGTPYEKGEFRVSIVLPSKYPCEPPKCKFITRVYHPNIDESGRICLDTLVMPPKGCWKPSLNMLTVLQSIQLLLSVPNPEDPLVVGISQEFQSDYGRFAMTAREYTSRYAVPKRLVVSGDSGRVESESDSSSQ